MPLWITTTLLGLTLNNSKISRRASVETATIRSAFSSATFSAHEVR